MVYIRVSGLYFDVVECLFALDLSRIFALVIVPDSIVFFYNSKFAFRDGVTCCV